MLGFNQTILSQVKTYQLETVGNFYLLSIPLSRYRPSPACLVGGKLWLYMTTYDEIVGTIPSLSNSQLRELQVRIGALLSIGGNVDTENKGETDANVVLGSISEVLVALGVENTTPSFLRKSQNYSSFTKELPLLMSFMRKQVTDKNQLRALLDIGIRLLYEDMRKMGIPISGRTLILHMGRLPSVFDLSFPGYARLEMPNGGTALGAIVRRK